MLRKTYHLGTGDESQNLGHIVRIRLHYNHMTQQFEGKWFVHTHKYRGSDVFCIWLKEKRGANEDIKDEHIKNSTTNQELGETQGLELQSSVSELEQQTVGCPSMAASS